MMEPTGGEIHFQNICDTISRTGDLINSRILVLYSYSMY